MSEEEGDWSVLEATAVDCEDDSMTYSTFTLCLPFDKGSFMFPREYDMCIFL